MLVRPFSQLDLNLLRVFIAVAQEKKTILAAERLNMTQPAVSRALGKLRRHFNDPLFVRTRKGLEPTSKGLLLSVRLPSLFDDLQELFRDLEAFDAITHEAELKIAINNFLGVSLPAKLFLHLQKSAPKVKLNIESWGASTMNRLKNGELDLGINYRLTEFPKEIVQRQVGIDSFQFLVRNGHPLMTQEVDIKHLASYSLVSPILPDWNEKLPKIVELLKDQQLDLKVLFRAESIPSLLEIIAYSDAFLPLSSYYSNSQLPNLTTLKLSEEFTNHLASKVPEVDIYMHYRHKQNPLFKWLIPIIEQQLFDIQHQ